MRLDNYITLTRQSTDTNEAPQVTSSLQPCYMEFCPDTALLYIIDGIYLLSITTK